MQLVAIQIANQARRIQHRPRPAGRDGIDDAKRIAAFLGIGSDHDCHVMIWQRHRQVYPRNHIKRQQLDPGLLQQELDRRVAAHVDRGRERKNTQFRLFRGTWRAKQLMKREYFRLHRNSGLPVAQQLRYQRQIETFARAGRTPDDLRYQFVVQRTKIGAAKRHGRKPGESDPIGAQRFRISDRLLNIKLHLPLLPALQTATRHDRGGSQDRPRFHRRYRSSACRRKNPRSDKSRCSDRSCIRTTQNGWDFQPTHRGNVRGRTAGLRRPDVGTSFRGRDA